jgi:Bacterial Ig domain/CHRD domain
MRATYLRTGTREGINMRHPLNRSRALAQATLFAATVVVAVLTACGGGYGSSSGSGTATCGSGYANSCPAPTVSVTAPAAGATVSGTVMLTASASASSTYGLTIMSVEFLVDNTSVGMATKSPYTVSWNSTTVSNGDHSVTAKATDSMGDTATSAAVTVNVQNAMSGAVEMRPQEIFPMPTSHASGKADLNVKLDTGAVSGKVTLDGLTATSVTINEGFAGATGPAVIDLMPRDGAASDWVVPEGALLTADQITSLQQGKLYVLATSAAHPRGELRGQITPATVIVTFSPMGGSQELPPAEADGAGVIAATVDTIAHTLSVHVNSTGVDDASAAEVDMGAAGETGPKLAELSKDSVDMGHWSTELARISAADVARFKASGLYVNVATPVAPGGVIRGQITIPAAGVPEAVEPQR